MNLIKKQILLITTAIFALVITAAGQPAIEMNFQGILTNGEGEKIANEKFDLTVKLTSADPSQAELWSFSSSTQTDEEGWLSFSIPEFSRYLIKDGIIKEPVVIWMEFLPNEKTRWIRTGEDFMVSYTLIPTLKNDGIHLKMSRMEGSDLEKHQESNLFAFKDEYPFAYLTGGFLLTDAPPLSANSMEDLRQWILPDPTDSGAPSRGVKGGFPEGGYRKKN